MAKPVMCPDFIFNLEKFFKFLKVLPDNATVDQDILDNFAKTIGIDITTDNWIRRSPKYINWLNLPEVQVVLKRKREEVGRRKKKVLPCVQEYKMLMCQFRFYLEDTEDPIEEALKSDKAMKDLIDGFLESEFNTSLRDRQQDRNLLLQWRTDQVIQPTIEEVIETKTPASSTPLQTVESPKTLNPAKLPQTTSKTPPAKSKYPPPLTTSKTPPGASKTSQAGPSSLPSSMPPQAEPLKWDKCPKVPVEDLAHARLKHEIWYKTDKNVVPTFPCLAFGKALNDENGETFYNMGSDYRKSPHKPGKWVCKTPGCSQVINENDLISFYGHNKKGKHKHFLDKKAKPKACKTLKIAERKARK